MIVILINSCTRCNIFDTLQSFSLAANFRLFNFFSVYPSSTFFISRHLQRERERGGKTNNHILALELDEVRATFSTIYISCHNDGHDGKIETFILPSPLSHFHAEQKLHANCPYGNSYISTPEPRGSSSRL